MRKIDILGGPPTVYWWLKGRIRTILGSSCIPSIPLLQGTGWGVLRRDMLVSVLQRALYPLKVEGPSSGMLLKKVI